MSNLPSYFETLDSHTLCRGGGNGPKHESQLYAIIKYVQPLAEQNGPVRFLDYGSGSGTTYEAIITSNIPRNFFIYTGTDIIAKNIDWCKKQFSDAYWEWNSTQDKIDQLDKSFDVIYSRHVVDHMKDFSAALKEHCRVAKKLVIIVLWKSFAFGDEDKIEQIKDNEHFFSEYTNSYTRKTVMEAIKEQEKSGWKLLEIAEGLKSLDGPAASHDVVIVLERKYDT